jgi:hypothetical protein
MKRKMVNDMTKTVKRYQETAEKCDLQEG